MPVPYASAVVPAAADTVWALVRDFNGLPTWHPAIAESTLIEGSAPAAVGAVRKLTLGDGGEVQERLVAMDDTDRRYTYEITKSPFPIRSYRSTIRVAPITATGESFVEWWTVYDSEAEVESEMNELFAGGVFAAGLGALREHFGG